VEVSKHRALISEARDIRREDLSAVRAGVREAHVISNNEQDRWSLRKHARRSRRKHPRLGALGLFKYGVRFNATAI
jgi:hypothetical protein